MGLCTSKPQADAAPAVAAPIAPPDGETVTAVPAGAPEVAHVASQVPTPAKKPVAPEAAGDAPAADSAPKKPGRAVEDDAELRRTFAIFAAMDTDKSGFVDQTELAAALKKNKKLRKRLCDNTATPFKMGDSFDVLAGKILKAADDSGDGKIQPAELERAIRGWANVDYEKVSDSTARGRQKQLKGAAARAEKKKMESGGFAGLTDAVRKLSIALQPCHADLQLRDRMDRTSFSSP